MVMLLQRPADNDDDFIDAVVLERQNGVNAAYFAGVSAGWKQRVKDYCAAGGNPEVIAPWLPSAHQTKFQTLYVSPQEGSTQRPVLRRPRNRQLQLCPSCGEDGAPNTLDHYLPKNAYAEFCITPSNLLPMCDSCQHHKDIKTVDGNGRRFFIHPYFDQFVAHQVVKLSIAGPYASRPSIELSPYPGLSAEQYGLVARHVQELSLQTRFPHFFKTEYIRLIKLAAQMRSEGMDVRRTISAFKWNARQKAVNNWPHVFYDGVVSNEGLLNFLETGVLPTYV